MQRQRTRFLSISLYLSLFLVVFRVAHITRTTTKMKEERKKKKTHAKQRRMGEKEMCGIKIAQMPSPTSTERKRLWAFVFFIWVASAATAAAAVVAANCQVFHAWNWRKRTKKKKKQTQIQALAIKYISQFSAHEPLTARLALLCTILYLFLYLIHFCFEFRTHTTGYWTSLSVKMWETRWRNIPHHNITLEAKEKERQRVREQATSLSSLPWSSLLAEQNEMKLNRCYVRGWYREWRAHSARVQFVECTRFAYGFAKVVMVMVQRECVSVVRFLAESIFFASSLADLAHKPHTHTHTHLLAHRWQAAAHFIINSCSWGAFDIQIKMLHPW